MEYTGYWIFICNPKFWAIDDFLEQNIEISTWKITEWQKDHVKKGDLAVIRVGLDKRTKIELNGREKLSSGIYAVAEIIGEPEYKSNKDDNFWLDKEMSNEKAWRAKIRYTKNLLDSPLLIKDLKLINEINKQSVLIKSQQSSSWPANKLEFEKIMDIINIQLETIERIKNEVIYDVLDMERLILKYQNSTPKIKEYISRKIERGEISQKIKKIYNYECMICKSQNQKSHCFNKKNGTPYIETHHFFPVRNLQEGLLGIKNLMTVCPNHHRQLHYGNVNILQSTDNEFIIEIDGKKITIPKTHSPNLHRQHRNRTHR